MNTKSAQAVARVLEQQKSPHWDGTAHAYGLAYMAEGFLLPAKPATDTEEALPIRFDTKGFAKQLAEDSEWQYTSNMKKALEKAGDIPSTEKKMAEYKA